MRRRLYLKLNVILVIYIDGSDRKSIIGSSVMVVNIRRFIIGCVNVFIFYFMIGISFC